MSEHIKEPWHTGKNHNAERFIYGEDGWAIAECVQTKDKMFANARRIVACVNACAEITNDELASVSYAQLLESHHYLQQQRDELLAALSAAMDDVPGWYELARTAKEKAEATS